MLSVILNILFMTGGAGIGIATGWWLRSSTKSDVPCNCEGESKEPVATATLSNVEGLMARLHQLTTSVAADVGEHSNQVQQINAELTSSTATPESIVSTVEKLIFANEKMNDQLKAAENRLQAQADEIQSHVHEARTDALTTLFNRRGFDDELESAVAVSEQSGRPVSMMMMDVDFFKKFNDTYGHQAGDEVLKSVARVVRSHLTDREVVCRYGGEEFAAIFPGSDVQAAVLGAERARNAVRAEIVNFDGLDLRVTASVGLSERRDGETAADFVKRADQALYASKSAGRNRSHWHDGFQPRPVETEEPAVPAVAPADDTESQDEPVPHSDGMSSRAEILADIDRRLGEWRRGGASLSLVLMKIDRYKQLAGEDGGSAATVVARAAAIFLKATIRDMDHVARFDHSTFALLLPTATSSNAQRVAERLRKAVERCVLSVNDREVRFTVSVGVAEVTKGDSRDEFVARTARALVKAAVREGNRVQLAATDAPDDDNSPSDLATTTDTVGE